MKKLFFILIALFLLCVVAEIKGKVPPGTSIIFAGTSYCFPMPAATLMQSGNQFLKTFGMNQNQSMGQNMPQNFALPGNMALGIPGADVPVGNIAEMLSANIFNVPNSVTLTITSTAGVGGVPTDITVLNNDKYAAIDDNGSGPGSIEYFWQDGSADGTTVSELISQARPPYGLICWGVVLRINTAGVADAVALAASNPVFQSRTTRNNFIPIELNPSDDQTRDNTDFSMEVMPCVQNISRVTQLRFTIPGDATDDSTVQVTFYFKPNYKR